jgi:hypothetical protein
VANIQQTIDQAKALAQQGNSQTAIASLSKLIQSDASNVEAWLALAEVVEEPVRAEFCLKKVLALDPGNSMALEKLSELQGGRPEGGQLTSNEDDLEVESIDLAARLESTDPIPKKEDREALSPLESETDPSAHASPARDEPLRTPDPISSAAESANATATPIQAEPALEPMSEQRAATQVDAASPASDDISEDGQRRSRIGRTDLVLIGLTVIAGLVLCGLVGAAVVGNSSLFSSQPTESPDDVVQVVFDNIFAANREDVGAYMATIHPNSPGYNTTHETIKIASSLYDLSYEIFIPEMLEQGRSEAVISFVLTTRKIRGPAFQDNIVTGEMTLRKHEGEWKIYDQRVDDVQYLN